MGLADAVGCTGFSFYLVQSPFKGVTSWLDSGLELIKILDLNVESTQNSLCLGQPNRHCGSIFIC